MTVPLTRTFELNVTSLGATVDFSTPAVVVPWNATVTLVEFVPAQTQITATAVAATTRTYTLYNRGGAPGTSTGIIARGGLTSLSASATAFGSGFLDNVASSIPLNAVTASLSCAAGDVLEWESSHTDTGLREVGGRVRITLSRASS